MHHAVGKDEHECLQVFCVNIHRYGDTDGTSSGSEERSESDLWLVFPATPRFPVCSCCEHQEMGWAKFGNCFKQYGMFLDIELSAINIDWDVLQAFYSVIQRFVCNRKVFAH